MVREAFYFGLLRPSGEPVPEADWQAFLTETLTPRFASGFTILDATGQYRDRSGKTIREPTKLVIVIHAGGQEQQEAASEVSSEYRKRFAQESVLREREAVCARF